MYKGHQIRAQAVIVTDSEEDEWAAHAVVRINRCLVPIADMMISFTAACGRGLCAAKLRSLWQRRLKET